MQTIGMKSFTLNGHLFALEARYCNKAVCRCHKGQPHGPYWYIDHARYVGKELPEDVTAHLIARDARLQKTAVAVQKRLLERVRLLREQAGAVEEEYFAVRSASAGGYLNNADREILRKLKLEKLIPPSF